MTNVYLCHPRRSAIGRFGGTLASVRPDDLAAHIFKAVLEQAPELDPAAIDEVMMGCANQAGEDNRNVARMSALLAGLPTSVPGTTLNSIRATTFFQNQLDSRSNTCIRSNQLTKMPANSGIMIAHRNGLLLDQAEQSISQPTVGNAHSANSGMHAIRVPRIASGLAGPHNSVAGLPPWNITTTLQIAIEPSMVASAASTAITGATTVALATLDSTV